MVVIWWTLLCYIAALPFLLIGVGDNLLAFSFYLNGTLIAYMAYQSIIKNVGGPAFATINVFGLLFFYVAPIFQILEYRGYLINNYAATESQMIQANILIFLLIAVFMIIYLRKPKKPIAPLLKIDDNRVASVFPVFVGLAIAASIWAVRVMLDSGVEVQDDAADATLNIAATIRHKFAFVIPFAALGFYLCRKHRNRSLIMVAALLILVLASKNVVFDRRNSLGPIYLSVVFLLLWKWTPSSRNVFLSVGSALLFIFPITSIFMNNPAENWPDLLTFEGITKEITNHFVDMHYDAWANFVATLQFVQDEGLQLGRQMIGTLLFFFPRSLWPDKPVSSGQMLGDYLMTNHGLWFSNISFPFPAEGYVDFGITGIVVYAAILGIYSRRLDYFVRFGSAVDRTSALYFAFYLTFVMRGALLVAVAYGVGAYLALNVLPAMLSKIGLRSRGAGPAAAPTRPAALPAAGL